MLKIETTNQFERDYKRIEKQGKDINKLTAIMDTLAHQKPLDLRHRDHKLKGNYTEHRECHIEPDWLLIYKMDLKDRIITFVRTGSHADLFE
ncbi:MAG: addiction module toxin RelE [Deltaproteobacteria bacterium RIFOXYA2_FULL_42_10]|nr:MAG: addiction module toxin RelE [Deltaproteobacteria bacterium RIFOXYA2_FULL_42_10]